MYSTTKFLFLYSSRNGFTKEWENIFADSQNSGACPWKSAGILSPKLGKNTTILGNNLLNRAKLPPGQGPQIRNDISPPAFRFCSVSNFKLRRNWFFAKDFRSFPVFFPFVTETYIYSLLIMENIMFKSFVWLLAHLILCRSFDVLISGSTLYVPTTPIQLSPPIK